MNKILTIILGGGRGNRLYPLTKKRAKPACPFGGKYRLVDIPISNSINSKFRQIYVLTQYNSASLHLHIGSTYNFDPFNKGFCEILAARQGFAEDDGWYVGTADAVRKNMEHFRLQAPSHYIVLSGDQLYRMDLADFMKKHVESDMEISVAVSAVNRNNASTLGILKMGESGRVAAFVEKPGPEKDISEFRSSVVQGDNSGGEPAFLASMGIYIFNASAMEDAMATEEEDFGKNIIPESIEKGLVGAYVYRGYWEDIGTIKSYFGSNLDLGSLQPRYNLYDQFNPLYTHRRDLPPTKINSSTIYQSLASEGSIITNARVDRSLIGIRTIIGSGASLSQVYTMGTDFYETEEERFINRQKNLPNYGIGEYSKIHRAIIDLNVRIGKNCRIGLDKKPDGDYDSHCVRDGILIVPKGAVIPDETVI